MIDYQDESLTQLTLGKNSIRYTLPASTAASCAT